MVSVMHGYFGTETFEPLLYIRNGRKRLDKIKMTIKDLTVILISFSLVVHARPVLYILFFYTENVHCILQGTTFQYREAQRSVNVIKFD